MPMVSLPISDFQLPISLTRHLPLQIGNRQFAIGNPLDSFAVINRLLALLQSYVCLFPGRLTAFKPAALRHLAHEVDRADVVHLYLKDGLDCRLDLRLGCASIYPERQQLVRILRFFFRGQRLFSNHRQLDDVPNCSHLYAASSSVLYSVVSSGACGGSGEPSPLRFPSNCSSSVAASRESTR